MGSIMYDIACPQCGRFAYEDYYYTSDQKFTWCTHCGYTYSNGERYDETTDTVYWDKSENKGYGVFRLVKREERGETILFNSPITEKQLHECKEKFEADDTNKEESILVSYENGEFVCLLGTLSEGFILPYEDYLKWYREKYGLELEDITG